MTSQRADIVTLALRALLAALCALVSVSAPVHASWDDLHDPCLQAGAETSELGSSNDLDDKFHAAHGCGTCHVHAYLASPPQASTLVIQAIAHVRADERPASGAPAEGPYKPPRA